MEMVFGRDTSSWEWCLVGTLHHGNGVWSGTLHCGNGVG